MKEKAWIAVTVASAAVTLICLGIWIWTGPVLNGWTLAAVGYTALTVIGLLMLEKDDEGDK